MKGQKVKGIGPSALEVLIGSGEQEPTGAVDRTTITDRLGHNLDIKPVGTSNNATGSKR